MSEDVLPLPISEDTSSESELEKGEYGESWNEKEGGEMGEDNYEFQESKETDEDEDQEEEKSEEFGETEEEGDYDSSNFVSRPFMSPSCTLPEEIVKFNYSYGYDCQRLFNLCVVDKVVLIFASGNIIHFFDTETGTKWYRRSSSGCGIGHITKNPKETQIAVGEKGDNPPLIVYEWPSFEIVTILKRGTKKAYTFLNYSPDGELLCSQGGQPDYTIAIWNWRNQRIMLRAKAYGQDVFNSKFSLYSPGHLTSSGVGHIKFWKIERTFTGLKLLGELGRFGKSEICNVIGFLALPDEKVVSGCEWGNILVWDEGLIRVEVFRRGRNFCHEAPITQFIYNNGDLTTVAMDGSIKVWYYETIELADPPEEDKFIEVEPIFELEVGDYYHKARLHVIVEADPNNPKARLWYGQDGNGGIWSLDLSMSPNAQPATLIFHCHAGAVAAIQCSPFSHHFASLGEDGRLFVYDYKQKVMIMKKEFLAGGRSLLWLPLTVEESGCVLIGGFSDGVVRIICVSIYEYEMNKLSPTDEYINLIQVLKPHTKAVTVVTINPKHSIIVTGSEDSTIFVYQIKEDSQFPKLVPIGYVPVSGEVTHCTWKPRREATILVSCRNGTFMEIELPVEPVDPNPVSYLLTNLQIQNHKFVSIKGEIRRNQRMEEIKEERRIILEEKRLELIQKAEESGVRVDESALEALQAELNAQEPELPEKYIPKIPSPILFASYTGKTIWLSMGGYDAGYMYEYNFSSEGPVGYKMIPDADDIEISCYHYYHNYKYLILGMKDGKIRVIRVNSSDHTNLSNYWSLSMHDNDTGTIRQICFNYNFSYMFTCGSDGNVFSYAFSPENKEYKNVNVDQVISKGFPEELSPDIDDQNALSLEQVKNRIEYEERMKEASAYKRDLMEVLKGLEKKFEALLRRNAKLPKSQQLTPQDLILDERIVEDLRANLDEEMDLVKLKLAWQSEKSQLQHEKVNNYFIKDLKTHALKVHGIRNKEIYAETFRIKNIPLKFQDMKDLVIIKLEEQEAKGRDQVGMFTEEEITETITRRLNPVEGLLKQIMVICGDYKKNIKLRRLLRKYKERKDKLESRRIEWYEMMKKQPNPNKPDPEDVISIELAKESVGNYQLKSAADYTVSKSGRITTVHVYEQLLKTREEIYNIKENFNYKVLEMRQRKLNMIERHEVLRGILLEIAKEIPKEKIIHPPNLPSYVEDVEFPEKKFTPSEAGIFEEIPKRYRSVYKIETPKKKEVKLLDKEYEMLILEKKNHKLGKVQSRLSLMKYSGITGSRDFEELEEAGKDDQIPTPWEKECQKFRVMKRLYEKDRIIEEMEAGIREFDEDIARLSELRYQVEVDVKFLELFLLTLYQEVLILKRFETAEEEKENKLFEKLKEKHEIQKILNEINSKVEGRNREIRRCEEEIKNLVTLFHATSAENKFYDYLRRIFKKKYKPPKVKTDESDSESESESTSSSDEEDAKSLDSKEIGPLRMDETMCPLGCDPHLYEWTFEQRSARHELELNIMEEKRQIDLHKKESEILLKKIKNVEAQYLACKEDLEEYMREKQRNLNEVETVVVLRLSQIQNFKSESEIEKISESVVFSASVLMNLHKRIAELEKETLIEKQKHEKNRHHLMRMKVDVNHMKGMIGKLTKEIEAAMIRKLGAKVDLDDVEESLLKRLVAEMHTIVMDLERDFDKKIQPLRREITEKENKYAKKIQENTERFDILTVLQEEKLKIQKIINRQDKIMCGETHKDEDLNKDIGNLRKVLKMQEEKIMQLRKEIASLKLKGKMKPQINTDVSDTIQQTAIKECAETEESMKEELRDMYEEAMEIVLDVGEGELNEYDKNRMRKLTSGILGKLPERYKAGVINRLSRGNIKESGSKNDYDRILYDIIKTLETDSLVEIMQEVKGAFDDMAFALDSPIV